MLMIYIQLYTSLDIDSPYEALHTVHNCISDTRSWMIGNRVKINTDHMQNILSLPRQKIIFLQISS